MMYQNITNMKMTWSMLQQEEALYEYTCRNALSPDHPRKERVMNFYVKQVGPVIDDISF